MISAGAARAGELITCTLNPSCRTSAEMSAEDYSQSTDLATGYRGEDLERCKGKKGGRFDRFKRL
jgi:hypothetical protein